MTIIGSEIIKKINILNSATDTDDTDNLNATTLQGLLEKYFQSIVPLSTTEPETPPEPLSEAEIEYLSDLKMFKQKFADFIAHSLKPENYADVLKIISAMEEISEVNLEGKLAIEKKYNREFTKIEIDMLISTKNKLMDEFEDLFIPLNELLKVHLDSKLVYQSIKAYKKPDEDNRTLTARLMMLLSEDKSAVYFLDTDADQIVNTASLPVDGESIPIVVTPIIFRDGPPAPDIGPENIPMAVTPILSELTQTTTPDPETGLRQIIRPPLGVYFNSIRQAAVIPISIQESKEATCLKMSPISSPKYGAMKRYAANNSVGS